MPVCDQQDVRGVGTFRTLRFSYHCAMIFSPDVCDQAVQPLGHVRRTLTTGAPVAPDVPVLVQTLFAPPGSDLRGRQPFVVPVVPLADGVCDGDFGFTAD